MAENGIFDKYKMTKNDDRMFKMIQHDVGMSLLRIYESVRTPEESTEHNRVTILALLDMMLHFYDGDKETRVGIIKHFVEQAANMREHAGGFPDV